MSHTLEKRETLFEVAAFIFFFFFSLWLAFIWFYFIFSFNSVVRRYCRCCCCCFSSCDVFHVWWSILYAKERPRETKRTKHRHFTLYFYSIERNLIFRLCSTRTKKALYKHDTTLNTHTHAYSRRSTHDMNSMCIHSYFPSPSLSLTPSLILVL